MLSNNHFTTVYVAKPEYLDELCKEVGEVAAVVGNLVLSPLQKSDLCFALDIWSDPVMVSFNSISEAAALLKQAGKFWFLNPISNVRRSHLIQEQLRKLPSLERSFPLDPPLPEMGCFSLLDKNTLLFATQRWKKWPLGHCSFIEDKINPPNRAYLKLWEALTLLEQLPKAGDKAIDLGATPGGWTYVMNALGAEVTAVDKAPLDPRIANRPGVNFLQQSAFAIVPKEWPEEVDWLLGDIACYPDRLLNLIKGWLEADKAKQMILTLKLQGETNLELIRQFKAIPNSRTIHLFHNKHEATFFYPAPPSLCYTFDPKI